MPVVHLQPGPTLTVRGQARLLLPGVALLGVLLLGAPEGVQASRPLPKVADVPSRPAFVRPPGDQERSARVGQRLPGRSLLRTQRPGRMQVDLPNGRSFRLGGDAVVRLSASALDLERGQLIAWINPGRQGGGPLRVRTRVGTASIEGTTVFLEVEAERVLVFSWEGRVRVTLEPEGAGKAEDVWLASGEQLTYQNGAWQPPRRLGREEAQRRRRSSILLNGFTAAMPTLPVIEQELEALEPAGPDGR
ncbi:conserved hypothetical protein [Cyanobium sp. PCC 7001]|uniref:FecR family protein n=1 Tax=Cyanobium sp. PCC 7001 TaxID=180281 RepID=UPI0001805442|nr:FecR family protein [Cyanobium sp. PCC 7001]EDY37920.1 conserved hypothetical protein [Cyanobium sp. PCC 7001]